MTPEEPIIEIDITKKRREQLKNAYKKWVKKQKDLGLKPYKIYIKPELQPQIKKFVEELNKNSEFK